MILLRVFLTLTQYIDMLLEKYIFCIFIYIDDKYVYNNNYLVITIKL